MTVQAGSQNKRLLVLVSTANTGEKGTIEVLCRQERGGEKEKLTMVDTYSAAIVVCSCSLSSSAELIVVSAMRCSREIEYSNAE